jgi:hypothetical protein
LLVRGVPGPGSVDMTVRDSFEDARDCHNETSE